MSWTMKSKKIKGFTVTLVSTESEGLSVEDGGKWVLICEEHGSIIQDGDKNRLWSHANEVAEWCEVHEQGDLRFPNARYSIQEEVSNATSDRN